MLAKMNSNCTYDRGKWKVKYEKYDIYKVKYGKYTIYHTMIQLIQLKSISKYYCLYSQGLEYQKFNVLPNLNTCKYLTNNATQGHGNLHFHIGNRRRGFDYLLDQNLCLSPAFQYTQKNVLKVL
jgi:hypothetical protein